MELIAVTGARGFIGQWFLKEFSSKYRIVALRRESSRNEQPADSAEISWRATDYSVEDLRSILQDASAVVHLAAARPMSKTQGESVSDQVANFGISTNLYEACRLNGISNVVNISSTSVYGSHNHIPYREEDAPRPDSLYGAAKSAVEQVGDYYSRRYGLRVKSLRVAQVVGLGEREGFMLMTFIKQAAAKQTLNLYGKGDGRREYIYVKDVAGAVISGLSQPDLYGVYNVGTGVATSHRELAELINEVFDNRGNLMLHPDKPEDTSRRLMDISHIKETLNWQPQWSLRMALEDIRNLIATQEYAA